jgi:cytochrome c-type biogenesis protein
MELYFGMFMPLVLSQPSGYILLPDFAVATGLHIILLAYLLAFSIGGLGNFYNHVKIFEIWLRRIVAVLFIFTGFYFLWIFFSKKGSKISIK